MAITNDSKRALRHKVEELLAHKKIVDSKLERVNAERLKLVALKQNIVDRIQEIRKDSDGD